MRGGKEETEWEQGAKVIKMEKHKIIKLQKFKTIAVPVELWKLIRMVAAKKGVKLYEEIKSKYEN